MEMNEAFFHNRKVHPEKLLAYGFEQEPFGYHYSTKIADGHFQLVVSITKNGTVSTQVTDSETGDEYVLHRATSAVGAFVGMVKADYEAVLTEIAEKCFDPDVFKSEQAKQLITYVREKYGDEPEHLWQKFPENAVWRRVDNQKWYGAILTVSGRKLGLPTDEILEIIDLRLQKERMERTVDHVRYFPGWHMSKKSWYTIVLDGRVPTEEIYARIDESYRLAKKLVTEGAYHDNSQTDRS